MFIVVNYQLFWFLFEGGTEKYTVNCIQWNQIYIFSVRTHFYLAKICRKVELVHQFIPGAIDPKWIKTMPMNQSQRPGSVKPNGKLETYVSNVKFVFGFVVDKACAVEISFVLFFFFVYVVTETAWARRSSSACFTNGKNHEVVVCYEKKYLFFRQAQFHE